MNLLENYDYFIFDLDGTIYVEDRLIDGSLNIINYLKKNNKSFCFSTNKTTDNAQTYFEFLRRNGFPIEKNQIITAGDVVENYLKSNGKTENVFVFGEKNFRTDLLQNGINQTENVDEIKTVIITLDRTFDYKKMEIAKEAIENGADFYAANIDNTYPTKTGEVIDAGSTIAALEKSTGRILEKHFGKPSRYMIDEIRSRIHFIPNKTLIIGDRLETDIQMGKLFDIDTVLVNTGVRKKNIENHLLPTFQFQSVKELFY